MTMLENSTPSMKELSFSAPEGGTDEGVRPEIDRRIEEKFVDTVQVTGEVQLAAHEQEECMRAAIQNERDRTDQAYEATKDEADRELQAVIEAAKAKHNEIIEAAAARRQTAHEGTDRAELQTVAFFDACRQADERIYTGVKLQKGIQDRLEEESLDLEVAVDIVARDIIYCEQKIVRTNDDKNAKKGLIEAYDESLRANSANQVQLHTQHTQKVQSRVDENFETVSRAGNSTDATQINEHMHELEAAGAGYGSSASYVRQNLSFTSQVLELQRERDLIFDARATLEEEVAELENKLVALCNNVSESKSKLQTLMARQEEITILKSQLEDDFNNLYEQAESLLAVTQGGIEGLSKLPEELYDVLLAALNLLACRTQPSETEDTNSGIAALPESFSLALAAQHDSSSELLAHGQPAPSTDWEDQSFLQQQDTISRNTHQFAIPAHLMAHLNSAAATIKAGPLRRGIELKLAGESR